MRAIRLAAGGGLVGLLLGLVLAILGAPYGRLNPSAFAELYHGTTDTSGQFHLALDCDTATPGTQNSCSVNAFAIGVTVDVDLTLGNSTGADAPVGAFNATVESLDPLLNARTAVSCTAPYTECSPDFLDSTEAPAGLPANGWACGPPLPSDDNSPAAGDQSFIACYNAFAPELIVAGTGHRQLARITYDIPGVFQDQSASLTLKDVNVFDDLGNELMSCNPVNMVAGSCFGATITAVGHVFPTPTWTSTPAPDQDGDGVLNGSDNCPSVSNSSQENENADFISNAPYYVVNDVTRVMSDGEGDACDTDDDGDLLADAVETPAPPCASASSGTNPLAVDTDGDRVVDAAECFLGFNPASGASKPSAVQCGAALDSDGDRVSDRTEVCGYGSNPGLVDSDGDGTRDGCEVYSLNMDQVVNSGDQLLIGQEILRRLGGGAPHQNFDVNKDGNANSGDQLLMATIVTPPGQCP